MTLAPSHPADTPWHQRPIVRLGIIGLGAIVLAFLVWRLFFHGGREKPVVPSVPVGVARIGYGDMQVQLTGLGTVTPTSTITVQTQINGQLTAVGYTEGQIVQKGQFLAQIDQRPYQIALVQAQGALAHDRGLLEQAKSDLARYAALMKENAIAAQVYSDQVFLVQQYTGTVQEDEAAVANAQLNIAYCHIVSPVTGRTGLRLVDAGNYIQTASSTGLVVITVLQPITVIFALPEQDVQVASQQMRAGSLDVLAYDHNNEHEIAKGALITIDNTVDTTTGTVKFRASFPNENLALFPNAFVNARLLLNPLKHVLLVPVRAIQNGAPGTFVYLVRPGSTVHVQVIKTGETQADSAQVLSGLKAGDTVVVDGAALLREGAKVRIVPERAGAPVTTNYGPGAPPGEQPQNAHPLPKTHHSGTERG